MRAALYLASLFLWACWYPGDRGILLEEKVGKLSDENTALRKDLAESQEKLARSQKRLDEQLDQLDKAARRSDADIDWLIPHQANIRIMQGTARKLKLPLDKLIVTVDQHGNTSAASIPLALDVAVRSGRIKKGDTLMLEGVGGGFTWGAVLVDF